MTKQKKTKVKTKPKKDKKAKLKIVVINHVREVMAEKGITGYKMAVDLNILNQSIYSYLMKEDYSPSVATALLLSEYLDTPITKLFEIKK